MRVFEDEQYRLDLRRALVQLDLRNLWGVGDHHPEAWTLDEVLPPRDKKRREMEESRSNSPERERWYQAFRMKCSVAVKTGIWDGPDVFPLPS